MFAIVDGCFIQITGIHTWHTKESASRRLAMIDWSLRLVLSFQERLVLVRLSHAVESNNHLNMLVAKFTDYDLCPPLSACCNWHKLNYTLLKIVHFAYVVIYQYESRHCVKIISFSYYEVGSWASVIAKLSPLFPSCMRLVMLRSSGGVGG